MANFPSVAVLDIGSNSIKVLVATRDRSDRLVPLLSKSLDARISGGISAAFPRLSAEGIARGLEAIQTLCTAAQVFVPTTTVIVATSAVRDAANGADFCAKVRQATGFEVQVLSGLAEANAIGRGLTSDPALSDLQDFYVFDLGGGSLECLAFQNRQIEQAISLQLGCVRLTGRFVPDSALSFSAGSHAAISRHIANELSRGGFRFDLPQGVAVATGGTVATLRAMIGAETGQNAEETPSVITVEQAQRLLARISPLTLAERRQVPGLPPARADVFPTALATLLAVAETGGFSSLHHSFHNLRYGLAVELLAKL